MTLSEFLRELKVRGEVILSVEDVKKMINLEDDFPDAKTIRIEQPINPKIYNYYGERKDNE